MYNECYGGFSLSQAAMEEYRRRCPDNNKKFCSRSVPRHDQVMAQIVREMGQAASGIYARVKLESIPAEYENYYGIYEYDGTESVYLKKHAYKLSLVRAIMKDPAVPDQVKLARIATVVELEQEQEQDSQDSDEDDHEDS